MKKKTIHQRCINVLLTEVYKYLNGYSPDLMNEVFYLRPNHYNLRSFNVFAPDNPRSKYLLNSSVYRFIYLFILHLKADKHQLQLCTLKK